MKWDHRARRERLAAALAKAGCDVALVTQPQNIYYFSGFWGVGCLMLGVEGAVLFTSRLEENRALDEAVDCEVRAIAPFTRIGEAVEAAVGSRRVLIDEPRGSLGFPLGLGEARMRWDSRPFAELRRVKDAMEEESIRHAAGIIDKLFEVFVEVAKEGASERELGATLVYEGMKRGAEPAAVNTSLSPVIVASGPRAAFPHANLSDRRLREGDVVVVDLSLRWHGYYADATRTFVVGAPSGEVRRVYSAVLEALQNAEGAARPGVGCRDVDSAARVILEKHGLSELFVHSTGHGVGLDIHEPPFLRQGSEEVLQEGDVVTVEPGVYLPNRFGVRIENTVSMRRGVLNRFPLELITVGG